MLEKEKVLLCTMCGVELLSGREKRIGLCGSCIESLSTSSEGEIKC